MDHSKGIGRHLQIHYKWLDLGLKTQIVAPRHSIATLNRERLPFFFATSPNHFLAGVTYFHRLSTCLLFQLAQLVEHQFQELTVVGSIPTRTP